MAGAGVDSEKCGAFLEKRSESKYVEATGEDSRLERKRLRHTAELLEILRRSAQGNIEVQYVPCP